MRGKMQKIHLEDIKALDRVSEVERAAERVMEKTDVVKKALIR